MILLEKKKYFLSQRAADMKLKILVKKVMDAAVQGCKDIHAIIDKVVRKHMKVTSTFDKDL